MDEIILGNMSNGIKRSVESKLLYTENVIPIFLKRFSASFFFLTITFSGKDLAQSYI